MWLAAIPRFLSQLEDQHVKENDSASFTCEVYPAKAPLTWSANGQNIKDGKKYKISSANNERKLVVKNVKEEDTATITAALVEESTSARLTVEGLHSQFCDTF